LYLKGLGLKQYLVDWITETQRFNLINLRILFSS